KGSKFLHNSVLITGPSATARALYWYVYSSDSYDATVMNNLFITNTSGSTPYAVYLAGTYSSAYAYNYRIDYNNYYSTGNMGYVGSAQATLANWKSVVISDIHSTFILPVFAHVNSNLELTDYSAFIVPRINDVPVDINGINRTILTMMGAYSKPLFEGYDLELIDILSPKAIDDVYCFGDYTDVKVILKNVGTENYYFDTNSVNLHLDVSGVYNYQFDTLITVGTLLAPKKDTFEITNLLPVSLPGTYHISVYLSSAVDTVYSDDTLHMDYTVSKIQLPYDVDFSYKPTDIILKQVLGTSAWQVDTGTGSNPTIAPVFGTGRLSFSSESGLGSMAQAIINGIDLRGMAQPSLEFWYAHDATSSNNDFMSVKVSTNGGGNFDNLLTVYRYDAAYATPGWAHYVVDLSDYDTNACVSIVFEANSFGGANQNIDRIRIASKPDVSLSLIAPKEEDLIACNLNNNTLKVVVSNLTAQEVDFDVDTTTIHLNVTGANIVNYTYSLSGQLAGMTSDTIEITNSFDLTHNGTFNVKAYLDAIDSNFVNDTAKGSILINPDLSIKDIIGVDGVNCKNMGDSVYVSFKILNIGNLKVDEIPVRLLINGAGVISETVYAQLLPGDSIEYAFTKPYVVPQVTQSQPFYNVRIQTELSCDAQQTNNSVNILACVIIPEVIDLQIQSINKPLETVCDTGLRTVYVSVTLLNTGNNNISSSVLHVEVDSAETAWASFSETTAAIPAGNTLTHVFTQGYVVPNFNDNYTVRVYIDSIENDRDLTNDTLAVQACAVLDDVSIDEFGNIDWTMDQNIPNPATSITSIPYAIPQDGQISFKVMSINGKILYSKQLQATAGSHSIEIDLNSLSNGIYYYSMEYQGQRIVKKMTVQR
ncbi:MAG TPA: T9SS type A sorting domain-containing protein, partial [Bacteroidales bacterium]|nr:T9SS type A sorting domain-containing protein [Bacteroidales bacterium]